MNHPAWRTNTQKRYLSCYRLFDTGEVGLIASWIRMLSLVVAGLMLAHAATDLDRMQSLALERYGKRAERTVIDWRGLITTAPAAELDKLVLVNDFFNRRIRFGEDIDIHGKVDHWASPLETMGLGAGDCEDFTIAKYMTLRLLGIPNERLRLIYVRAQMGGAGSGMSQAHMVLGYFPKASAEPLILDNLVPEIRPASRRTDLFPVFSFNSDGLWVGEGNTSSGDPGARLSRWRDVLARMSREGLQ